MFLSKFGLNISSLKLLPSFLVLFSVIALSSCSVINEGIKAVSGGQTSAKSDKNKDNLNKDEAQYATEEVDTAEEPIVMDKTAEVVKPAILISFNGKDPMAKVKINNEIRNLYSKTATLVKLKKYQQAIAQLEAVKTRYPQLSGPDYQLARIYYQLGQLDKALIAVDASVSKNQRNYYSINFRGVVLRAQGKFKQAKESYLKAIEIYPPYPNAHLNLGVLADIYMGDLDLALIQYRSYMELIGRKDKAVANWVIEIERRIKAGG